MLFGRIAAGADIDLVTSAGGVEISNAVQKVAFQKVDRSPIISGKFNLAAAYYGSSAEKSFIPSRSSFNSSERTIEFWSKLAPSSTFQVMVARGPKSAGHWEIYADSSGNASFYAPDLTPGVGASSTVITDNQWHFISLRIRTGEISLAVDGIVAVGQSVTGTIASSTKPIYLGSLPDAEAPNTFPINGAIDDLRLSNSWRASIASPAAPFSVDSSTIGLYHFDAIVANTFPDEAASNNAIAGTFSTWYNMTTQVKTPAGWKVLFDAPHSLVEGSSFNLMPSTYTVVENSVSRKALRFSGTQSSASYNWDNLVEVASGSPLVHFTNTAHLASSLNISEPQPTVAFWMNGSPSVYVDQGPMNIYGGRTIGFPAAYLWKGGMEAAVFFDMTPVRWVSQSGVARFYNFRVQNIPTSGQWGLGLYTYALAGHTIPSGDMVISYYLFGQNRPLQPSMLDGLDTMVNSFAPVHPASAPLPVTRIAPYQTTWALYAQNAIENLMIPTRLYWDVSCFWRDDPLRLVPQVTSLRVHPDRPDGAGWDFSTVNNHLSPWVLYTRLNIDADKTAFIRKVKDGLPLFYDPIANMIRYGTRQPIHLGDYEMSWQNFFFHLETERVFEALSPVDFNPAIAGRFLMSMQGLKQCGKNSGYIFGQWFDPYTKTPAIQQDVPSLGDVREPWQTGSYAYSMMKAHEITGSANFLDEAAQSIQCLLTTMTYRMKNTVYDVTYTNAAEFPITEPCGNAYGVVAACKVYEYTSNPLFLEYSRRFVDSVMRLEFWYEDEVNAVSRDLNNLGLILAHGGAVNATPWENTDAFLAFAYALKHDKQSPKTDLLLKLTNLYRLNSFYFFWPTFSDNVRALDPSLNNDGVPYLPIEPFYSSIEGSGGHRGPKAAYMANTAIWNYWLFEALARSDNSAVMVLNLDSLENYNGAIDSARRHFLVYNPQSSVANIILTSLCLANGNYIVSTQDSNGTTTDTPYTSAQLASGIPMHLGLSSYLRVTIRNTNEASIMALILSCETAQKKLSYAYQLLQDAGGGSPPSLKTAFQTGMTAYQAEQYDSASQQAQITIDYYNGHSGIIDSFMY
ncbi:MAG: LamG domain-containing protein [Candidatus Sumerlaeota bacterium]|nr:LamG domain-containing protein [Candidatus Sumerlaeota bacterium]